MAVTVEQWPKCECVYDGCCWTRTITYSYPAEIAEQREIRLLKDRVAELEGKTPPTTATTGEVIAALATSPFATKTLAEYIDAAIADEREACAKLADDAFKGNFLSDYAKGARHAYMFAASSIRNRK